MTESGGVQLELTLAELIALNDFVARAVLRGDVHRWAETNHPDNALPAHLGSALFQFAVRLEEARGELASMN